MKVAISGETLGSVMKLEDILPIFKENGVNSIEIWPENIPVQVGKNIVHKRLYANRDVLKAKEILEKFDMKVACVCFGAGFDKDLAENKTLFSGELRRAVEVAAELGANVVNHYCYYVAMNDEYPLEELKGYYREAIEKAEELKVYLALENEAHDITKNPVRMKEIVKYMGSEYFRTNYDATNYYQSGYEGFPYAYEILKDCIIHVHIKNGCIYMPEFGHKEACRGGEMTGALSGKYIYYPYASDGAVNIDGLLRRLIRDGYEGYCTIEPHTTPELCLQYYKEETTYLRQRNIYAE